MMVILRPPLSLLLAVRVEEPRRGVSQQQLAQRDKHFSAGRDRAGTDQDPNLIHSPWCPSDGFICSGATETLEGTPRVIPPIANNSLNISLSSDEWMRIPFGHHNSDDSTNKKRGGGENRFLRIAWSLKIFVTPRRPRSTRRKWQRLGSPQSRDSNGVRKTKILLGTKNTTRKENKTLEKKQLKI